MSDKYEYRTISISYTRLQEFLTDLKEAMEDIPEASKDNATVTCSGDSDWGYGLDIEWYRPETPEETAKRVKDEADNKNHRIRRLQDELRKLEGIVK